MYFFSKKSELSNAYKKLKTTSEGKIILEDILKFCGYNKASFVEGKPDLTSYNEGLKSYARRVLTLMNFSEADAQKMKKELSKNINLNKKQL